MLRVIGALAILLFVAIFAVCLLASTKPSSFEVSRSVTIAATPEHIKPLLNDFHNFASWSPWQKLDPNMTTSITGAPSGVGAVYSWSGNRKAGEGRMAILTDTPTITIQSLDFTRPFVSHNTTTYTLYAVPGATPATKVTWSMAGPMPFASKVMAVFSSMDKMVGPDFDRGLASLKAVAEK